MPEKTTVNNTPEKGGKGFSVTAMVCGICALVFCWNIFIAIVLAIIAIVFGIVALAQKRAGKGMAIAGIVTGSIGMVISVLLSLIVFSVAMTVVDSAIDHINSGDIDSITEWLQTLE